MGAVAVLADLRSADGELATVEWRTDDMMGFAVHVRLEPGPEFAAVSPGTLSMTLMSGVWAPPVPRDDGTSRVFGEPRIFKEEERA